MSPETLTTEPVVAAEDRDTANERFKRSFGSYLWGGILVATVLHFLLLQFGPTFTAADVSYYAEELRALDLPPEIEIPPPPEALVRPATPVASADVTIEEDITIAPTTFEENPVDKLPPPPAEAGLSDEELARAPTFTPYTVAPTLKNREEVRQALVREYPTLLRDAGIGGMVVVWFFIDESGRVLKAQVNKSSGHQALDQAAVRVAHIYEFTPALNRDRRVKVWVSLPISFISR